MWRKAISGPLLLFLAVSALATGGLVFSSPAVTGGLVYVGSNDGKVYAFGSSEKITFAQIGVSLDVAGTVLVVDDTPYGVNQLPTSFHWPMHSVHTFAFQTPLTVSVFATKQYIWTGTTGSSSAQSDSINVTASEDIVGNYKTQTVSATVGGFSVSVTGYGTAKSSSFYLTVLAMLSVAFATVRRKTRKKR